MREMTIDVPKLGVVEEVKDYWCYAGVEQLLRKAFKKLDISQTRIAHNCFLRVARTAKEQTGHVGKMQQYAKLALAQATGQPLGGDRGQRGRPPAGTVGADRLREPE